MASSVEGEACLMMMKRYIKLNNFQSSFLIQSTSTLHKLWPAAIMLCVHKIILCYGIQGDLFSEAPKPPVSQERNLLNESMKSTAQTAGKTNFLNKYVQRHTADKMVGTCGKKEWNSRMPPNFCFPSKNLANLERRFQWVPFQFSQVVTFSCVNADITFLPASSS